MSLKASMVLSLMSFQKMKMIQILCQCVKENNAAVDVVVSAILEDAVEGSLEGEEEVEASESEALKFSLLPYQRAAESFARVVELMASSNHSLMHAARPNLSGIVDFEIQNVMEFRKKTSRQSQNQ